jgi:uncharacterized RDD family membrane protein YckC
MYCPKCGTSNDDQATFCKQCGANLKDPLAVTRTNYAGFWKRVAAYLLDGLIIGVATSFLYFSKPWVASPVSLAVGWLYFSLMESSQYQATLGKMALGIKVTDMQGNRVSFGRATGRYFGKIVSGIIIGIGFLMVAFTQKKQGLHDIMANTLVINK